MKSRDVLIKWEQYFNDRDAVKLASLYHEDATVLQIAIGKPLVGRDEILLDSQNFFSNIPDNYTKIFNTIESGYWDMLQWQQAIGVLNQ